MAPRRCFYLLALLALLAPSGAARAESKDRVASEVLFLAGRSAMQAGDYAVACEQFRESERLEHGVGTWLNLGLCEEHLGHLASAWVYYERVLDALPATDARAQIAHQKLLALDQRLPRVTLHLAPGAPASTTVAHADTRYGGAVFGVALPMDVGEHRFSVEAPGFSRRDYQLTLSDGERTDILLSVGPPLVSAPPVVSTPVPAASPRSAPRSDAGTGSAPSAGTRGVGWALVAVGGAALVVAGVTGLMLLHDDAVVQDGCDANKACASARGVSAATQGRTLNVVSPVALGVGIAAAGIGTVLILKSPSECARTEVGARLLPNGAELRLGHAF